MKLSTHKPQATSHKPRPKYDDIMWVCLFLRVALLWGWFKGKANGKPPFWGVLLCWDTRSMLGLTHFLCGRLKHRADCAQTGKWLSSCLRNGSVFSRRLVAMSKESKGVRQECAGALGHSDHVSLRSRSNPQGRYQSRDSKRLQQQDYVDLFQYCP